MSDAAAKAWLVNLGLEPYSPVHELQLRLVQARREGAIPDVVLLLEHEPTFTLGRRAERSDVLASPEELAAAGIAVQRIERGGLVTYHGPGQLVAYPILNLHRLGLGASDYMHLLEGAICDLLCDHGLIPLLRQDQIGVWVDDGKIGSLGVRIRRGVSFHGLALNVAPNMGHWDMIIPCGMTDGRITSMARALAGGAPNPAEVRWGLARHLSRRLGIALEPISRGDLLAALREGED